MVNPERDFELSKESSDFMMKYKEMEREIDTLLKDQKQDQPSKPKEEMSLAELRGQFKLDMKHSKQNSDLMDTMVKETALYHEKIQKKIDGSINQHETLDIVSDMLETMLKVVDDQIPKEEFRNIDNTPKHLVHMKNEDFQPKSPAVLREELTELIKEAKSKIKPVLMTKQDKDKYI